MNAIYRSTRLSTLAELGSARDPTLALRRAERALTLWPENPDAEPVIRACLVDGGLYRAVRVERAVRHVAFGPGVLWVAHGALSCFDVVSLERRWCVEVEAGPAALLAWDGQVCWLGTWFGSIHQVDAEGAIGPVIVELPGTPTVLEPTSDGLFAYGGGRAVRVREAEVEVLYDGDPEDPADEVVPLEDGTLVARFGRRVLDDAVRGVGAPCVRRHPGRAVLPEDRPVRDGRIAGLPAEGARGRGRLGAGRRARVDDGGAARGLPGSHEPACRARLGLVRRRRGCAGARRRPTGLAGGSEVHVHPNEELITRFYTAFAAKDAEGMAACYHPQARFSDPVFPELNGDEPGWMWRMLCARGKDLEVRFSDVKADDEGGSAHWDADYTFSTTGRMVNNRIDATFTFEDGLIKTHTDVFDFYKWSRMALGVSGLLLGWTPFLRNKVGNTAGEQLRRYIEKNRE